MRTLPRSLRRPPLLGASPLPVLVAGLALAELGSPGALAGPQGSFVNWETPHVHPLDLTPEGPGAPAGRRLLAVNTPDARLEVFDASEGRLAHDTSIPVGLDPVSVRARTASEAWVVNHVSDSVSVVNLATGRVTATLDTDDEPCDVVFAGRPERAFVSCSQANTVLVFDPADLAAAPLRIALEAEDPRALAVSPDGGTVYAAVFESGNRTTLIGGGKKDPDVLNFPPNTATKPDGPYGGVNPPPNSGGQFEPPQNPKNPPPPKASLIVRKDGEGRWMDDNGGDWTELVTGAKADLSGRLPGWDLLDHDVAVLDAQDLSVGYVDGLMNANMACAVNPASGRLSVVGTDARNEIRYEPNLTGRFLRVLMATAPLGGGEPEITDLNPHLTYGAGTVRQPVRDLSLGDPRGIAWNAAGTRALVTGMGSNNVVVVDPRGVRVAPKTTIEVGEGPTGVVLHPTEPVAFVLNKFEAAVSVLALDLAQGSGAEVARVPFYDPSPAAVRAGRRHLYGTHETSGLGHIACASCHIDGRMDRLAWDLGDPSGEMKSVDGQNLAANVPLLLDPFEDWHPMKGPMLTQTLQDIIGKEPHHWRGDRDGLEEFANAFVSLQGDDEPLSAGEMQEFEDFLATIHFPPNPFRDFDGGLPEELPLPGHFTTGRFQPAGQPLPNGDAVRGLELYRPPSFLDQGQVACVSCHTLPVGIGTDYTLQGFTYQPIPPGPNGERHHALMSMDGNQQVTFKVPHLRNLYERTGANFTQLENRAGFGYLHDGSFDSIERFVSTSAFEVESDQDVADLVALLLSFSGSGLPLGSPNALFQPPGPASQDTHAAVGTQVTLAEPPADGGGTAELVDAMLSLADASAVGLIAKGVQDGEARGYAYVGGAVWQSDRAAEQLSTAELTGAAGPGEELTWTVVPDGTQTRMGVDRDEDGFFDRDELDAGSDPADPTSTPG